MIRDHAVKFVLAAAWVFQASALLSSTALAQSATDIVGMWTLVSSVTDKDGKRTDQFGPGAHGMMSLDADGHFMLTIIGPDLPKFASNNRASGTSDENKAVVGKSIAMIGTYSVGSTDKSLTFKVESSTFPNWNGTAQKRSIVTAGRDELQYITAAASSGGIATVTWQRAR